VGHEHAPAAVPFAAEGVHCISVEGDVSVWFREVPFKTKNGCGRSRGPTHPGFRRRASRGTFPTSLL